MRVLVAIANYGTKNDVYLERLLTEYRSLPYRVDLVVLSNLAKDLGPDVEVRVGLPDRDPWSLPFGHKQLFADRRDDYDLFIYSEDDMLIGRRQIEAFLEVTPSLPDDQIAGFLQYEEDAQGRRHCPAVHTFCHWVPGSVRQYGSEVYAYLTNEHAACYLLTRAQLQRALASGGFLVPPHKGFYDLLCTAATDPYTQCGFTKVLCLTRIEDFLVYHLPNKYIGKGGLTFAQVQDQMQALLRCRNGELTRAELLGPQERPSVCRWSKSYCEPVRPDVLAAVPREAKQVLSVGCGAGVTEAVLVQQGIRVVAIPLDAVVGVTARSHGLEVLEPSFPEAFARLQGERFDGILLTDLLPYVPDPEALLGRCGSLLAEQGRLVVTAPSFHFLGHWKKSWADRRWRRAQGILTGRPRHSTTPRRVAGWLRRSGLCVDRIRYEETSRFHGLVKGSLGLAGPYLSHTFTITAGLRTRNPIQDASADPCLATASK
ncbi:MAG: class I SAM-dependent methyltransferase [Planctomycetes bacterium]|nr:class I SAM-dependent methyltransferase [Planctomycetota bacterium]